MPQTFHLALLIHAHQPCGNFEHVFKKAYEDSYLPFLQQLENHPGIHVGLHYSGPLLTWMEKHRPEYFDGLKKLVQSGHVELVGGGFYEPILVSIPPEDQCEQITRLASYLEQHFGQRPSGAWLAERVWEPQLPTALANAKVAYTLVDDLHFLAAGFEPEELFGAYIAEDRGKSVWLYPGQKKLRYIVPFGKVEEVITFLREAANVHPDGVAAMGDDMEKFGVWPGTNKLCYQDGWLSDFFAELEKNSDWLNVCTPGEYLASHSPLGRADLPTASYTEMMEWAFPTRVRQRFHAVLQEFGSRPEVLAFLRGGSWRGFFRKYPESNLLNKKMLRVSARIAAAAAAPACDEREKQAADVTEARDLLLRAQCNDAYWHGIFGGIYAPHLRTDPARNLIRAEVIADRLTPGASAPRVEMLDYDADGASELLFTSPEFQALLKPSDGGTLAALDFRPAAATLINSILRRPESYHTRLREAAAGTGATGATVSIHEQTRVKEPGLSYFFATTAGRDTPSASSFSIPRERRPITRHSNCAKTPRLPAVLIRLRTPLRRAPSFSARTRFLCMTKPRRPRRGFFSSRPSRSIPVATVLKSSAKFSSSSKNFWRSPLPWESNPSSIFSHPRSQIVSSKLPTAVRIFASAARSPRPFCAWKTAGSAFASPCTRLWPKDSGSRRLKPFLNPKRASSASTRARRFSPSGIRR